MKLLVPIPIISLLISLNRFTKDYTPPSLRTANKSHSRQKTQKELEAETI